MQGNDQGPLGEGESMKKWCRYWLKRLLLLGLVFFVGCEEPVSERRRTEDAKVWQRCFDSGGIPIRSAWSGAIIRCDKMLKEK